MTAETEHKSGKGIAARIWGNFRQLPLWRQVLLVLVLSAMIVVAGVMLSANLAGSRLSREVVKISKAGEPLVYADLHPKEVQPQTNEDAAQYYREAVKRIRPSDLQDIVKLNIFYRLNMVSLPADKFPAELRDKTAQNLTKTEPLFAMLDRGAQLPLSEFDTGVLQGKQICKDRLDSIQGMVFLSSLRTLDLIQKGNVEKAAQSLVTTMKLLRSFDSFPTIPVQGRKMICLRLVCSDILLLINNSVVGRISEKQLEQLQSLLDESFSPDALEKTLLAERIYQLEVGRNLIPRKVASKYLSPNVPSLPERLPRPKFRWHRMRIGFGAAGFLRDMSRFIEISRLPWPEPLKEIKDVNSTPSKGSSGLISTVAPLTRLIAETLVAEECAKTALAIERYRRQEKALPEKLEDLYPQYIESIPLDPFTGRKMLYAHDDKAYKVFSVANVRIDDVNSIVQTP